MWTNFLARTNGHRLKWSTRSNVALALSGFSKPSQRLPNKTMKMTYGMTRTNRVLCAPPLLRFDPALAKSSLSNTSQLRENVGSTIKKEDKPVAATQVDVFRDSQDTPCEADDDRSPLRGIEAKEKTKSLTDLDPDKVFLSQNPKWSFASHGGQGDCAFRCAAFSIAAF